MKLAYALLGAAFALALRSIQQRSYPRHELHRRRSQHRPSRHSAEAEVKGPLGEV